MTFVNSILRRLFDLALAPFSELHPLVGIALISLIFGVVMLLVFKKTSNQDKLADVKRKIHAGLFEIRLFNDDFRAIMRAQVDILRHNLSYFGLSLVPLAWMIVPLFLVIAQLQFHYAYQGLEPGDPVLVKVAVEGDAADRPQIRLEAPEGLKIEAGPVWIPPTDPESEEGEPRVDHGLTWRISAVQQGDYELKLISDGETITKSVRASDHVVRRSPNRVKGFLNQLIFPAEDPLPDSTPIREITVTYPAGNAGFEGWESELTWMGLFFILSIVFALVLRKPLKVTI